jgi:NAD+ kinase
MKNIAINVNSSKDKQGEILEDILKATYTTYPEANITVFNDSKGLMCSCIEDFDMVIVLGGDGTILSTARALPNKVIPILGVNIGNLGFLASIELFAFKEAISQIRSGNFTIEERMMLKCTLKGKSVTREFLSLNDIVISKGTLSRIVRFDITVDDNFYTAFTADGVIISTPTGSTAYSLSAGGPIIYPTLKLIEITPICPHSPGLRSLVLNSESVVSIGVEKQNESVFLTVDGQESIQLLDISDLTITRSKYACKLIRLNDYDYFNVLRKKIIWRTRECEGDKNESSKTRKDNRNY